MKLFLVLNRMYIECVSKIIAKTKVTFAKFLFHSWIKCIPNTSIFREIKTEMGKMIKFFTAPVKGDSFVS